MNSAAEDNKENHPPLTDAQYPIAYNPHLILFSSPFINRLFTPPPPPTVPPPSYGYGRAQIEAIRLLRVIRRAHSATTPEVDIVIRDENTEDAVSPETAATADETMPIVSTFSARPRQSELRWTERDQFVADWAASQFPPEWFDDIPSTTPRHLIPAERRAARRPLTELEDVESLLSMAETKLVEWLNDLKLNEDEQDTQTDLSIQELEQIVQELSLRN